MLSEYKTPASRILPAFPILQAAEQSTLEGNPAMIGAFNVNFYAQSLGIDKGAARVRAPYIKQVSKGARDFQGGVDNIMQMINDTRIAVPGNVFAVHLDHGDVPGCVQCVDGGFTSVMMDASHYPDAENIAISREIARYAHKKGLTVEAEYGLLSGVEEDISHQKAVYADPEFVVEFLRRSGVDMLALAYGTSHGPNKGNTEALNIDILKRSYKNLLEAGMNQDHFFVSHGSSTVPEELIERIGNSGGDIRGAKGVPVHLMGDIARYVRKINIDTDLRMGITSVVREYLRDNPKAVKESFLLGYMHEVLVTGGLKPRTKGDDGKPIPKEKIIDPRDYLWPIVQGGVEGLPAVDPKVLRIDYGELTDKPFIELMDRISGQVADQVSDLCDVFGSKNLSEKVDRSIDLEKMTRMYGGG